MRNNYHNAQGSAQFSRSRQTGNKKTFNPLLRVLDIIRGFDPRAYITHDEQTGEPHIKYRCVTGKRIILGYKDNTRLAYDNSDRIFTLSSARKLAKDLDWL